MNLVYILDSYESYILNQIFTTNNNNKILVSPDPKLVTSV